MAQRKPLPRETAKQRAVNYMTEHIRKSYPRWDRHGGYAEACGALAEETGGDPDSIYEEWLTVAETRLMTGTLEVEDAEIEALREVQERWRSAS